MRTADTVDSNVKETWTDATARRLRGQLAERRISQLKLSELTGWGRGTTYRRVSGQTSLSIEELEQLWLLLGIDPVYLITGAHGADEQTVQR